MLVKAKRYKRTIQKGLGMTQKETGMIRHILLIKFKEDADASEIEKLKRLFEAMP